MVVWFGKFSIWSRYFKVWEEMVVLFRKKKDGRGGYEIIEGLGLGGDWNES